MTYSELHSKLLMCENDWQSFSDILKMSTYQNLPESVFKQKMRSFMQNLFHRRKQVEMLWIKSFPKSYGEFVMMTRTDAEDLLHIMAVCPKRMAGFELNVFDVFRSAWIKGRHDFHRAAFVRIFKGEPFMGALLKNFEKAFEMVAWLSDVVLHEASTSCARAELLDVLKVWKKAFDADAGEKNKKLSDLVDAVLV